MASNLRNVKLKPSKICNGVGLFPIEKVLKGEVVLNYLRENYPNTFDISTLSDAIKKYLYTIWGFNNFIPSTQLFHPVNFLNHSENPAVRYDILTGNYIATRDISPNDEITINYIGYNDQVYNSFKHLIKKRIHCGSKKTRRRFKYRRYI